jgi:hypothetical protein
LRMSGKYEKYAFRGKIFESSRENEMKASTHKYIRKNIQPRIMLRCRFFFFLKLPNINWVGCI